VTSAAFLAAATRQESRALQAVVSLRVPPWNRSVGTGRTRQIEPHACTAPGALPGPHGPSVRLHDRLDDSQAQPHTPAVRRRRLRSTVLGLEQAVPRASGKAGPSVRHSHPDPAIGGREPH
jgi:hypothetical protein